MDAREEMEAVRAARRGDLAAFDRLARRYRPALVALARGCPGDAAEDVAQDALLAAYKALPSLRDPARFGPWLLAIARHRARRLARAPREVTGLDGLVLLYVPALTEAVALRDEARAVRAAVASLSDEWRVPVALHYGEGWAAPEIARFLDLPLTTVKWRLHAARQALRPLLKDHEQP